MKNKQYVFSGKKVPYYFGETIANLSQYADPSRTILVVDDQVEHFHGHLLKDWRKIIIPGNESSKELRVLERLMHDLIRLEADRKTVLIGIGGGVITDLTGFAASIYMRGIPYAFAPTTLLAQVDASIGGKNGIDFGEYKNMLGVIRQPEFLLFDDDVLNTLPATEWYNGFAEIIKYGCITDAPLFEFLEKNIGRALVHDKEVIAYLVERSAEIKSLIVQEDELEGGARKLLNFGHTVGHAVERIEHIAHGQAVAKGMCIASVFSEKLSGLSNKSKERIIQLIKDYHLPAEIHSNPAEISHYFNMDKKREKQSIHFILLKKIGEAIIEPLPLTQLSSLLEETIAKRKS